MQLIASHIWQFLSYTNLPLLCESEGSYDRTSASYCEYRELESRTVHVQNADQFLHPAQYCHKHYSGRCGFLIVHAIECACWLYEACKGCIMHRSDAPQSFWHLRIKYPGPAAAAFFSDHRLVLNLPATLYTRSFPLASTILQLSCSKLYPVKMEYIKRW